MTVTELHERNELALTNAQRVWNMKLIMNKAHRKFNTYKSKGLNVLFATCLKLAWEVAKKNPSKYTKVVGIELKKEYNKYNNEDENERFFILPNMIDKKTEKAVLAPLYVTRVWQNETYCVGVKWVAKSLLSM